MKIAALPVSFIAAFLARAAAAFGGLALSVIIARLNGVSEMGAFAFALSVLHFSMIFSRYGLDMVLTRSVARGAKGNMLPVLRRYLIRTITTSLAVLVAVLILAKLAGISQSRMEVLRLLMLGLPFLVGVSLFVGYLRGAGHPAIAALCETGGLAGVTTVAIALMYWSGGPVSIIAISLLYTVICMIVFTALFFLVRRIEHHNTPPPPVQQAQTAEGAKWFWIVANTVFLSQAGALDIGGMVLSDIDVGHLRLAERLGLMAGFALTVTDPVVARFFARDHGNRILLKRHFMLASGFATIFALTISIFIIFFNDRLLDLVGGDAEIGRALLYVYLAGSVFNAMTGTSSMLLSMTGNEKFLMRTVVLTFLLAMPSYYFGGLAGGAMGFAVAYLLILVLKNSIIFLRVLQILSGPGADMDANGKTG